MVRTPNNITKVSRARPETTSARTTIPAHIVTQLGLDMGDALKWELDKTKDGVWVAVFRKEAHK